MKGWLIYWLMRAASGAISLLPEGAVISLGRLFGGASRFAQPGRYRMAVRVMGRLGATDPEADGIELLRSYGRYWAESMWFRPRRAKGILGNIQVEGIERIRAARDAGKGVIIALPHVGNWELVGTVAESEELRAMAVAEALTNKRLVSWFTGLRSSLGIEIVLAEGSVMGRLREAITAGRAVALLADRDLSGRGVAVRFFGEETTLPVGPIRLAITTGAPVLAVAPFFADGKGHRVVVLGPLDLPTEGSDDERLAAGTQLVAEAFETLIRRDPTQWHLVQPNWPSDRQ